MSKTKLCLICCLLILSANILYYHNLNHQKIKDFDKFPESNVQAYVCSSGCFGETEDYAQLESADYDALMQIISKIRYMNPNIDPLDEKFILYGGGGYTFKLVTEDFNKTFNISSNKLESNIRRVELSDGTSETYISAYIEDSLYADYERLAKKYLKEPKDSPEF